MASKMASSALSNAHSAKSMASAASASAQSASRLATLASICRFRLSIFALASSILAAASALICAHLVRVWSAACWACCWVFFTARSRSPWAWSIRFPIWSRDSVAAACTSAFAAATRCWSASNRCENSIVPPWMAPIAGPNRSAGDRCPLRLNGLLPGDAARLIAASANVPLLARAWGRVSRPRYPRRSSPPVVDDSGTPEQWHPGRTARLLRQLYADPSLRPGHHRWPPLRSPSPGRTQVQGRHASGKNNRDFRPEPACLPYSPATGRCCCPRSASSGVEDVGARGVDQRSQATATRFLRCGLVGAAPLAEPGQGVRPPAALLGLRGTEPFLRVSGVLLVHLIAGLRVTRRVDQRGDVATGRQHEPALAAEQLRAAVAVLPRGQVVGDPSYEVGVDLDA